MLAQSGRASSLGDPAGKLVGPEASVVIHTNMTLRGEPNLSSYDAQDGRTDLNQFNKILADSVETLYI